MNKKDNIVSASAHYEFQSSIHEIFYDALYKAELKPIPDYKVEKWCHDFAIIDGDRRLGIKIDGEPYLRQDDDYYNRMARRNESRKKRLIELGWDDMRILTGQILNDIPTVIKAIRKWLDAGRT